MRKGITKEEYFNDGLTREMPHDELHDLIKLGDQPAYKSMLLNGEEVYVSKEVFERSDSEAIIEAITEEVVVNFIEKMHNDTGDTYLEICKNYLDDSIYYYNKDTGTPFFANKSYFRREDLHVAVILNPSFIKYKYRGWFYDSLREYSINDDLLEACFLNYISRSPDE